MTLARAKSYSIQAVCVFLLYWLFWLPGFIANWIFLHEGVEMERRAGVRLPGVGRSV
jgi:hypothetical protein